MADEIDPYEEWRALLETDMSTSSDANAIFQTLLARDREIQQLTADAYAMYEGWRKGFDIVGPMNNFRKHHLSMIYLDGSKNAFRCHCGCNVFYKGLDENGPYFECNACNDKYRESKADEVNQEIEEK